MEKIKVKCDSCDGTGWTSEFDAALNSPVQVQCEKCDGTGKYETGKM